MTDSYRDLLQEGLAERVARRLKDETEPDSLVTTELVGFPPTKIAKEVTSLAMGRLNTVVDWIIDAAICDYISMVRFAKRR